MQIGLLNHLTFPKGSNQPLAGNSGDASTAAADGTASPGLGAIVRALTPAQDAPGVILKLQNDSTATPGVGLAKGLVYSNGRKAAAGNDGDSDTERMALQHSQALQRSVGSSTKLTLDKDGVLVAGSPSSTDTKPEDFVTFAVHTMRDYADEQDRLKQTKQGQRGGAADLIPRGLAEVQKLTARFKLFS